MLSAGEKGIPDATHISGGTYVGTPARNAARPRAQRPLANRSITERSCEQYYNTTDGPVMFIIVIIVIRLITKKKQQNKRKVTALREIMILIHARRCREREREI